MAGRRRRAAAVEKMDIAEQEEGGNANGLQIKVVVYRFSVLGLTILATRGWPCAAEGERCSGRIDRDQGRGAVPAVQIGLSAPIANEPTPPPCEQLDELFRTVYTLVLHSAQVFQREVFQVFFQVFSHGDELS